MSNYRGIGIVTHLAKQICSGTYEIIKDSHPDRQTVQSGTFEVTGISPGDLINIFNLLASTPPLVLTIQDGRSFNISLALINNSVDFSRGFAAFKLIFAPGNAEI